MSKEKQIEEMSCKKCLHYEMCLENFRKAKEEGLWELTEEDEYFAHADKCDFYAAGYRKQSEGEWILTGTFKSTFPLPVADFHKACSVCRWFPPKYSTDYKEYNFCPNCGAHMRGENK